MLVLISSRKSAFRITVARDGDRSMQVMVQPGRNTAAQLLRALNMSGEWKRDLNGDAVIGAIAESAGGKNLIRAGVLEVRDDVRPTAAAPRPAAPAARAVAPTPPAPPPHVERDPVNTTPIDTTPPSDPDMVLADGTELMPWDKGMRVEELRAALSTRGIDPGNMVKRELVEALEAWDDTNREDVEPAKTGDAS
jgi:hypothetical protein